MTCSQDQKCPLLTFRLGFSDDNQVGKIWFHVYIIVMNNVLSWILSEFMCFPSIGINRFYSDVLDIEFPILFIGN